MTIGSSLIESLVQPMIQSIIGGDFLSAPAFDDKEFLAHLAAFQDGLTKPDLVTVDEEDEEDEISSWNGYSGTSFDGTQGTTSKKPKYLAEGLNGLPSLDFDGDDFFTLGNVLNLADDEITIFVVAKFNDVGGQSTLLSQRLTLNTLFRAGNDKISVGTTLEGGVVSFEPQIYTIKSIFSDTNMDVQLFTNNTLVGSTGLFPRSGLDFDVEWQIGVDAVTSAGFMDGLIGEILAYKGSLEADEQIMAHAYLKAKWRIVG